MTHALFVVALSWLTSDPPAPSGQIAYMAGGRVCLCDAGGGKPLHLTDVLRYGVDRPLVWSPDGSKLLYWSHSEIGWDLWVTDPDGKNQVNLTHAKTGGCRSGAWSADGKKIAFMRDDPPGLYVMDADGKNQTRLSAKGHRDAPPAWSPDGKHLLFIDLVSGNGTALDLYRIDSDGANERLLAHGASDPCWLSDGAGILFSVVGRKECGLCRINAEGNQRTMLSKEPVDTVRLAPDGKSVAYVASEGKGSSHLWVMDLATQQARQLTKLDGNGTNLSWSADGQWLTLEAGSRNQETIYVINLAGDQKRRLVDGVAHGPVWRPRR